MVECVLEKSSLYMLLESDPSLEGTIQPLETGNCLPCGFVLVLALE